eukprot:3273045-Pyramimonas_sp.AAC.1
MGCDLETDSIAHCLGCPCLLHMTCLRMSFAEPVLIDRLGLGGDCPPVGENSQRMTVRRLCFGYL